MKFDLVEVDRGDTLAVETMRTIRNTCREYMTRSTKFITHDEQTMWWAIQHTSDPNRTKWKPYVLWTEPGYADAPIGYGILHHGTRVVAERSMQVVSQEAKTSWWLSGGVLPDWRGKGAGRALFSQLIELAGGPCWLEVRADNTPARELYGSLGFQVVAASTEDIVTMRRP